MVEDAEDTEGAEDWVTSAADEQIGILVTVSRKSIREAKLGGFVYPARSPEA
jgi:hypothetical protein